MKAISTILLLAFSITSFAQQKITISSGSDLSSKGIYLSKYGIISDADLSFGSSTFGTDQTAAIQNILNLSTATHPLTIYWDVKVSITGDSIKNYTTIIALEGCGAILRDNSDRAILSNYHATPGTITDSFITIIGGIWNGNGYRGGVAKQSGAHANYGNNPGIRMNGVRNLIIKDLTILNTRSWATNFFTTENVLVSNVRVDQGASYFINQDGVHFEGYANNIKVYGVRARCGDDALAFNCMSASQDALGNPNTFWVGKYGPETNIDVRDIYIDSCTYGIRITSGNQWADNINIENVSGKSVAYWLIIDNFSNNVNGTTDPGPGNVGTIRIANANVNVLNPNYGLPGGFGNALIQCNAKKIIISNYTRNFQSTSTYYPALRVGGTSKVIKELIIDGFYIDTAFTSTNKTPQIIIDSATVNRLTVMNARVTNSSVDSAALISVKRNATVGELILNNISTSGIYRILRDSASINYLSAVNIRHVSADTSIAPFYVMPTKSILDFVLSGFFGYKITEGTFPSKRGDGFEGLPPYP